MESRSQETAAARLAFFLGGENSQSRDVAERIVLVGAVALDGRVEGRVVVELRVVRRRAAAGVAADVPRRRRAQPQLAQDRVHRRRWTHKRHPGNQNQSLSSTMINNLSLLELRRARHVPSTGSVCGAAG